VIPIFVPFTRVKPLTDFVLRPYSVTAVKMEDRTSYPDYWQERWDAGEAFINVEHDVVPWPGAIEELDACPEDWCAFGYHPRTTFEGQTVILACCKFREPFIAATLGVWEQVSPRDYAMCDSHLSGFARQRGLRCHQHFPPVVHDRS